MSAWQGWRFPMPPSSHSPLQTGERSSRSTETLCSPSCLDGQSRRHCGVHVRSRLRRAGSAHPRSDSRDTDRRPPRSYQSRAQCLTRPGPARRARATWESGFRAADQHTRGGPPMPCRQPPTKVEHIGNPPGTAMTSGLEVVSDRCSRPAITVSFPKAAECGIAFMKET